MRRIIITTIITVLGFTVSVNATIIDIPDDYPTIQQGIDVSSDGDTVLVQPGTYVENIIFCACEIVVGSLFLTTGDISYIFSTVIDGDSSGPVIDLMTIGDNSVIAGFTIQNGSESGINCLDSWSTIRNNIIRDNIGGGIYTANSPNFINNNIIMNNIAEYGGAIYCMWYGNSMIINNIMIGNQAYEGGTIYISDSRPNITNNILWDDGISAIVLNGWSNPIIEYNNIQGSWDGEGNIDTDPLFRDPEDGDFHLMSTECGDPYDSPCIDTGSPAIIDSLSDCDRGLGTILSDMGAYGGGDSVMVGIDDYVVDLPDSFALLQNYPNPFNVMTVIQYSLSEPSDVAIEIFDILGRKVETLVAEKQPAGYHKVAWDASDRSSGIYFYRIQAEEYLKSRSCILLK